MRLYYRYVLATLLVTWLIFLYVYFFPGHLTSNKNSDHDVLNIDWLNAFSAVQANGTCLTPKEEEIQLTDSDHLRNLNALKLLAREKTDELLLAKDPKDKNGIALNFLNLIADFVAVDGGNSYPVRSIGRSPELEEGSKKVQSRLLRLQYPSDCKSVRKVNCNVFKNCGIGCQLHHLIYCLSVSFGLNRTLVIEYNQVEEDILVKWADFFLPFSSCTIHDYKGNPIPWSAESVNSSANVLDLPMVETLDPRPEFLPLAIPASILEVIKCCHRKPDVWWIGQLAAFIMRPNYRLQKLIKRSELNLGLLKTQYLGCHIRRTDKVGSEAKFHHVFEYHTALYDAYQMVKQSKLFSNLTNLVYLATDDTEAVKEFKSDFKFFKVTADLDSVESAAVMERKAKRSIAKALVDIFILSKSQFIVCTFSSQFCRIAYELMQSHEVIDMSWRVESLDDMYYFGGQNEHFWEAIANHTSHGVNEMALKIGDKIRVSGDLRNGYFAGINQRSQKEAMFPAYKVREKFNSFKDAA